MKTCAGVASTVHTAVNEQGMACLEDMVGKEGFAVHTDDGGGVSAEWAAGEGIDLPFAEARVSCNCCCRKDCSNGVDMNIQCSLKNWKDESVASSKLFVAKVKN